MAELVLPTYPGYLRVPDGSAMRCHLIEHPRLAVALNEICETVRREVGEDAELSLEMYCDPEIEEKHPVLYVRQTRYDERIMDKLETVWQKYPDLCAEVLVTTDFQPPRGAPNGCG